MNAYLIQYQESSEIVIAPTKKEARAYYQGLYHLSNLTHVDTRLCTTTEVKHTVVNHNIYLNDILQMDDTNIRAYRNYNIYRT